MASTLSAKPLGARTEWATRAVFFIGGFGAASWVPLVPLLKARLDITECVTMRFSKNVLLLLLMMLLICCTSAA